MNELEDLLRQQLHTAADPIEVPVDERAVLAEGRRARRARILRRALIAVALVAAMGVTLFAVWLGARDEDRRAVPNPFQSPSVEPVPTASESPDPGPSPSPSTVPSTAPSAEPSAVPSGTAGEAALIDFRFRDRPSQVRVEATDGGLRFTGVDVGDGRPVDIAEGDIVTGQPERGWTLAVLPRGTTWALYVAPDEATRMMGGVQQVVAVPGTDLVAYALVIPEADADAPSALRLVYGTADGRVYTNQSPRDVPAENFTSLNGREVTWFISDQVGAVGAVDHGIDDATYEPLRAGFLPGTALMGPGADSMEFVVVLPAGADPASLAWGVPDATETVLGPTVRTLSDGRTMVHRAFRRAGLSDHMVPEFTVTYSVNGVRTTDTVALGP